MDYHDRIVCNYRINSGKPTIAGTRIPVQLVLKLLAQGWTYEAILQEYPDLQRDDILAVITYAQDTVAMEEVRHTDLTAAEV